MSETTADLCARLAEVLQARGWMLATAESCTGGLIAAACTDLSGSSNWFERGFVTYSNEAKVAMLGVDEGLIAQHGAVSEVVARAMAFGAVRHSPAQVSVAVTGVAGPAGGSPQKPVGTVAIAMTGGDMESRVRLFSFFGGRPQVKFQASQAALDMVRRRLQFG